MYQPILTTLPFTAWLAELDNICQTMSGLSYQDFTDQPFKTWHEEGLSADDAFYKMMDNEYPGVEQPDIYYQEFDEFSDADSGL